VKQALANSSDLAADRLGVTSAETSALGTRSGILPVLVGFASLSQAGLAGAPRTVIEQTANGPVPITALPYFVGGVGTALGQVFRRDFPTEVAGLYFRAPIGNQQAQADYGIDQLQLRQTQLNTEKDFKQVQVDVMNSVVALRQARARYDAAVHSRILAQQLLDAEQKKFGLGASTPYLVVQQQRDLASAQSTEISALVSYSNARVALDRTLGTTLDVNHVNIGEVRDGKIMQASTPPPAAAPAPRRTGTALSAFVAHLTIHYGNFYEPNLCRIHLRIVDAPFTVWYAGCIREQRNDWESSRNKGCSPPTPPEVAKPLTYLL
jgi:hypothetical protein